jgi:drug/metabolite transporter (DMT)-like permease
MLIGLLASVLAALAFGVAAILQAIGARGQPVTVGIDPWLLIRMLRHPAFLLSAVLTGCGFLLHLFALRTLPLLAVQPLIASSVAVTAVVQNLVGLEPLSRRRRWLVLAVCIGLTLVTSAAVSGSAVQTSPGQRSLLLIAVVVIAAAGWQAGRVTGARGSSLLGLLSGFGFAVVAVAGRAFPSLEPASLATDPAAAALVAAGGIAYLLYSTALQRGTVITATAPMVVANTIVPVLVGVLALGDRFRSGWGPAAVIGLVIAGIAVVLLHDPRELHDLSLGNRS